MKQTDQRALGRWDKSDISYRNYTEYIKKKSDRYKLMFIDLLYVSNFKGGNASFHEEAKALKEKLKSFSKKFREINATFGDKHLKDLEDKDCNQLIECCHFLFNLSDNQHDNKIDGFGASFLTTLLHFHFPNLYPILDRRVLNGAGLISKNNLLKSGQVKNIKSYYPDLIRYFRRHTTKEIRELDKKLFIIKF